MIALKSIDDQIKDVKKRLTETGPRSEDKQALINTRPLRKKLKRLQRRRRVLVNLQKTTTPAKEKAAPAKAEPDTHAGSEAKAKAEAKAIAEPDSQAESEAKAKPEANAESETKDEVDKPK